MIRSSLAAGMAAFSAMLILIPPASAQQQIPPPPPAQDMRGVLFPRSPQTTPKSANTDKKEAETVLPPPVVEVHFRAVETTRQTGGTVQEKNRQAPILSTVPGKSGKVSMGGPNALVSFEVLPFVNADGTITVHVVYHDEKRDRQAGGEQTRATNELAFTRKLSPGIPASVTLFEAGDFRYFVEVSANVQAKMPAKDTTP